MTAIITQIIVIPLATLVGMLLIKSVRIGYTLIAIQVFLAIVGSLYYSNFGDPVYEYITGLWFDGSDKYTPCTLCYWARMLMYPLFPLAIIGALRRSREFLYWIIPAAIFGVGLEIYHYTLQKVAIASPFGCTAANPCNALKVDYFDFITIPYMCLTAFVVVLVWSIITFVRTKNGKGTDKVGHSETETHLQRVVEKNGDFKNQNTEKNILIEALLWCVEDIGAEHLSTYLGCDYDELRKVISRIDDFDDYNNPQVLKQFSRSELSVINNTLLWRIDRLSQKTGDYNLLLERVKKILNSDE